MKVDIEKEKEFVRNQYQWNLQRLEQSLPSSIKAKVADLRVLALDHTTQEVIDEITACCKANRAAVETASNAYDREFIRNFAQGLPDSFKGFGWHDDTVLSIRKDHQDLVISFASTFTNFFCRFMDAEIISCDGAAEGAVWLYDEIYPIEGGYEIQALLEAADGRPLSKDTLVEITIHCRDVEISRAARA